MPCNSVQFASIFLISLSALEAADFSLLSSSVTPVVQQAVPGQPEQTRFTLIKPIVSRVSKATTTPTQTEPSRFTLAAKSETVVVMNPPGLPELKLHKGATDLNIEWAEDELLNGFILEYSTSVKSGVWTRVDIELTATGRRHKVAPSQQQTGTRFYRLRKPSSE